MLPAGPGYRGNLQTAEEQMVRRDEGTTAADAESAGLETEAGALYCFPSDLRYFINAIPITTPTATAAAAAVTAIMGLNVSERWYQGVVRGVAIGSDSMICW